MHNPPERRCLCRPARVAGLAACLVFLVFATARAGAPPAPVDGIRVINYDLQGAKGPLAEAQFSKLKPLLVELKPDLIALHTVLQEAGRSQDTALVKIAQSLDMYYAYQPLDDRLGSALLSRYPIRKAICVFDAKTQATMGMLVTVQAERGSYRVMVVRPPTAAVARATAATVLAQLKSEPGPEYLLLASFSPALGARPTVAAWTKAGAFDPFAKLKASETFPFEKPKERLDFILLSPPLKDACLAAEVVRRPMLMGLSEHLPVLVTLRK